MQHSTVLVRARVTAIGCDWVEPSDPRSYYSVARKIVEENSGAFCSWSETPEVDIIRSATACVHRCRESFSNETIGHLSVLQQFQSQATTMDYIGSLNH